MRALKTKYPQGGEKQLIEAVAKRQVPAGKLPIDVGVIVLNVGTCAAIADAIIDGKPLIKRLRSSSGQSAFTHRHRGGRRYGVSGRLY